MSTHEEALHADRAALIARYEREIETLERLMAKPDFSQKDLDTFIEDCNATDVQMQTYGIVPKSGKLPSPRMKNVV